MYATVMLPIIVLQCVFMTGFHSTSSCCHSVHSVVMYANSDAPSFAVINSM